MVVFLAYQPEASPYHQPLSFCCHWPGPANDLKEVFRVLAPEGQFLIVADIYGGADLDEDSLRSIEKFSLFNPTPEEFEELLKGAGFKNVEIHTKKGTTWICAEGKK